MQEEAAERRRQENENRGIKDPEKVRRQQERAAKMERDELEAAKQHGANGPTLRVNWLFRLISFQNNNSKKILKSFSVASRLNAFRKDPIF